MGCYLSKKQNKSLDFESMNEQDIINYFLQKKFIKDYADVGLIFSHTYYGSTYDIHITNTLSKDKKITAKIKYFMDADNFDDSSKIDLNEKCSICYEDNCNKILKCRHIFHNHCIQQSYKHKKLCPYCREQLI